MTPENQVHLAEGQRAVAMKKYAVACEHFAYVVEGLTEEFGELAPETGDALMLYAKALISNAIATSAVLGGSAPVKEEEEEVKNAKAGPSEEESKFHFCEEESEEEEEEEDEQEPEEDTPDDFEMAFAILEMARATYSKIEGIPALEQLAEVHRLLGDVAMESERFEESLQEFGTSLAILEPLLPPYNRKFSELHMVMALALDNMADSVAKAISHAEQAKNVLALKIAQLEGLGENKTETDEKEIISIKELINGVEDKIQDLKTEAHEAPQSAADIALEEVIKTAMAKKTGVVNNLNSLVKRKKPVNVEPTEVAGSSKRKIEETEVEAKEPEEKKAKA